MKISTFTETPSSNRFFCNPTWYIDVCGKKLLFVSSSSDSFRKKMSPAQAVLRDIDTIILPAGCIKPVSEIQYFLFSCPHAEFYLPKAASQKYFQDILHKINGYSKTGQKNKMLSRIHFVDDFCIIDQNLLLFGSDSYPADMPEHRQSLLIQDENHVVLFANTSMETSALESAYFGAKNLTCLKIGRVMLASGESIENIDEKNAENGFSLEAIKIS